MGHTITLPKFLTNPDPEIYLRDDYLVLDYETTNLDKGDPQNPDNSLVLAVWWYKGKLYHKFGNEFEMQQLIQHCNDASFIVAHNVKFELQWSQRAGMDITDKLVYCTQIGEYVINGNRKSPLKLDYISRKKYGYKGKNKLGSLLIDAGVCPSQTPEKWLLEYCRKDVLLTRDVFLKQRERVRALGLLPVMYSRCLFTPVLADIELNGMHVDAERVTEEYNRLAYDLAIATKNLDDFTGGINPRSPKQVAEFLYDNLGFKVPKVRGEEKRKTDARTIASLPATNKRQKKFKELKAVHSKLNASMTKTILPLYKCATETRDNLLYAKFNQTITQTHRLSSSGKHYGVQFQNFPRAYKRMFSARNPSWGVGEIDSAQLEFRAAVILSKDPVGIDDINNGVDVHNLTASIIYEEDYEEVKKELGMDDLSHGELSKSKLGKSIRQNSKPHTFKPLYGGQSGTDREMRYYAAFREKYAGITAMQDAWKDTVLCTKKLRTVSGLIYYWPDTRLTKSGYITNSTNICNYPVQGFATADVMPIAIRFLWQYIKLLKLQSFLVNTVHDSAIAEIHPDEREIFGKYAELSFTTDVQEYMTKLYGVEFCVPLASEFEVNSHWGGK